MRFKFVTFTLFSFLLLTCISVTKVYAQDSKDVNAHSPLPQGSHNKKQQAAEKKKAEQKKENQKAIDKGIKQHEKLQDKQTRKRMKKNKKKAEANHEHKKEFFLKRWFTPGQKTKKR